MRTIIDNEKRYELRKQIGSGGFGVVYQATDTNTKKHLAIKLLGENQNEITEEALTQWRREAETAIAVKHLNVIETYDAGPAKVGKKNIYYIAMELADGGNLLEILLKHQDAGSLIDESELENYFTQMLKGLSEVHKTFLHRDIKPQNILIAKGNLKLSDFGFSKYVDEITRSKTYKGWGTYEYMAPETWQFAKVSKATDIYSLGILFYQLATLQLPYTANEVTEIEELHRYGATPRAKSINANLSHRLDSIIFKMIQKAPSTRYQSADDILKVLEQGSSGSGIHKSTIETLEYAKKKVDADTLAMTIQQEKQDKHDRALKVCKTHIASFVDNLQLILDEIGQQMPDQDLVISKGNETVYDVVWNGSDLIRFDFSPGLEESNLKLFNRRIIMHGTATIRTSHTAPNEGLNFTRLYTL